MAADLSREPSRRSADKCDSSGFAVGVNEVNVAFLPEEPQAIRMAKRTATQQSCVE